jgi:hypothetical protein
VAGPRYAIVASPLDPSATTLPIRAAFVPWLATVLTERLVGEPGGIVAASPGQVLPRPRWADAIEDETGARTALGDDLQAPARSGTYLFERGGRRVGALVVNPESNESVLDRLPARELAARVKARQLLTAADRVQLAGMSFRSAARRSVAEPILVAVLALLALEALLVRSRRRVAVAA